MMKHHKKSKMDGCNRSTACHVVELISQQLDVGISLRDLIMCAWIPLNCITSSSSFSSVRVLSSLHQCTLLTPVFQGAYGQLADLSLPDPNSPDYTHTLLFKARALIVLRRTQDALKLLTEAPTSVAVKATSSLARYVGASDVAAKESALEELRDLSLEIEGDDAEGDERDKSLVKVLAGTAFARDGEIEEALETLGTDTEDLEA